MAYSTGMRSGMAAAARRAVAPIDPARGAAVSDWLLKGGNDILSLALSLPSETPRVSAPRRSSPRGTPRRSDPPSGVSGTRPGSPVPGQSRHAATHPTANLPGYPAYDYMAPAGSSAVAPVSGTVIKLSGHNPGNGPPNGPHGPFGWSVYIKGDDGHTYFLTHMGARSVHVGQRVRRGQRIGNVGNYARWGGANHIHMGVN